MALALWLGGGERMPERRLRERVEIVERKVEALEALPARVSGLEVQILQLRAEMREGFSAIDRRFGAVDQRFDETHRYMRVLHEEVLTRIALLQEGRRPPPGK